MERPTRKGLLHWVRPTGCNREKVIREIRWDRGGTGSVVGRGGGGMARFDGHHGQVGGKAPEDRLHRPIEVPAVGVGFRVECHPGHRYGVPAHV